MRGYHFVHTAIDVHSRLVYSELLADERKETAASFWLRADAWFTNNGTIVRKVLTDNFSCCQPHAFREAMGDIEHRCARLTGHKPPARSRDSTGPLPTSGPTLGSTPATNKPAGSTRAGCIPTIITAATPRSAASHPPAVYLTCQVSTPSRSLCPISVRHRSDPPGDSSTTIWTST
jgi:hypothetical protein